MILIKNEELAYLFSSASDSPQGLLLFLHGFPDNGYVWQAVQEYCGKKMPQWDSMAFFAPGTLNGENYKSSDYSLQNYGQAIAQVVLNKYEKKKERPAILLVGHDMGGAYLSHLSVFLQKKGHHLRQVYVDSLPMDLFLSRLKTVRQWCQSGYMLFFQLPIEKILHEDWIRKAAEFYAGIDQKKVQEYSSHLQHTAKGLNFYRALLPDLVALLRAKKSKHHHLYFIWGQGDRAVRAPTSTELESVSGQLYWVGQGHWPMLSAPCEFATVLQKVVQEIIK